MANAAVINFKSNLLRAFYHKVVIILPFVEENFGCFIAVL